ncbi:hypothetical protein CMI41_02190 [Candidatus Pacearchaeota archaeon]|nr:hypothetical protein [Candidatus Pacearchaeota archaeon]|tara:strand:+ start:5446 stop:5709 length:264 start_codon:yes stop_codon:yes gene_type:complete
MANEMTWHEVTEKEREEIRKKAKELLDGFSVKLEKINGKESHFENDKGIRNQGRPWETLQEFRETTMSNAPFVENEFLVAEKGSWKK